MQKKMEKAGKQEENRDVESSNIVSKEERIKEKVVYKVVPVPYYYPVPVDAEWYYKHYEPPMRNGERGFHGYPDDHGFEHLPFHPPPAHGFPGPRSALRESYYYASSRDDDERYLRPVSPLYRHLSPSRSNHYSSPPPPGERKSKEDKNSENENGKEINKQNGVEEENDENLSSPRSASVKSELNESESEENKQNGDVEGSQSDGDVSHKSDKQEDENGDEKTSNSDSEVARKRKRFPMTFPYDQRKKNLKDANGEKNTENQEPGNGHVEEIHDNGSDYKRSRSEEPSAPRVYSSHKYSNGTSPNGHYPYVMVPIRSPPYGDVGRSPRYTERSHSYYESRMYDESYAKENNGSGGRKDDSKREIRYHPNGRRARTVFTRQQLLTLNNVFEKHPFVSGERMSELSDQLGLDRKIVKIWFQNKRQYARKKGSLVERGGEEYFYDYQDRFNPASVPPTMAERWKVES